MRIVRWGAALGLGALWWWGVLRLALAPDAGAVEGAVAAGGWGLSLLPVHCVPKGSGPGWGTGAFRGRTADRVQGDAVDTGSTTASGTGGMEVTTASPPRRSGG